MNGKKTNWVMPLSVMILGISVNAVASESLIINWSSDLTDTFSEFSGSDGYQDLADSEFAAKNYAEVVMSHSSNATVVISQVNHSYTTNKAKVLQSNSDSSTALIQQQGGGNLAVIEQGNQFAFNQSNYAEIEQLGYGHHGYISQSGNSNTAILKQCEISLSDGPSCSGYSNDSSELSIQQLGDNNVAALYDSGYSSYGITQSGNGHEIIVISGMSRGIYIRQ